MDGGGRGGSRDGIAFGSPARGDIPDTLAAAFKGNADIAPDGGGGYSVTLTGDIDGGVVLPDNIGLVTVDLNGKNNLVTGTAAARLMVTNDGGGTPTQVQLVNTSEGGGLIQGGDAQDWCINDGNPFDGIDASLAQAGVLFNVGTNVTVQGWW